MRVRGSIACVVLLFASGACHHPGQNPAARGATTDESSGPAQVVTGTVRHIDLEGGFYGIETDSGAKLDPVNLAEEFHKDGLRIRAHVQELKGQVSFRMWGQLVRILEIERL